MNKPKPEPEYEFAPSVLAAMTNGDARVLWRFTKTNDGRIVAVAYGEHEVIWIDKDPPEDL